MLRSKSSLSKTLLATIIVIAVVIVAVIAVGLSYHQNTNEVSTAVTTGGPTTITVTNTYTVSSLQSIFQILPQSYVFSLDVNYYWYYNFTVPYVTNPYINGSYTSTNNVEVLILTPEEFGAFTQNPSGVVNSGNYVWYSGNNHGATIYTSLTPGQTYYLVFANNNIFSSDTITIQSPINVWGYVSTTVTTTSVVTNATS